MYHVEPCGCMLTQTGGGKGPLLNHQDHILPLPHFFPWKLPINLLAEISTPSMGLRYLQQMSVSLRSPIFQEHLTLVLSVASKCEVDCD